jgi:hypothetical protein
VGHKGAVQPEFAGRPTASNGRQIDWGELAHE